MTEVLTYEALKADRDALAQRADALAVENAALKSAVDLIASAYTEGEPAGFEIDRARNIETPATSSALAAIEALGVEKFLDSEHCSQEAHGCVCRYIDELREAK